MIPKIMFNTSHLEMIKTSDIIAVVDLSTAISMRQAKVYAARLCINTEVIYCKGSVKSAVVINNQTGDKVIFFSISAASVKSRLTYTRTAYFK